MNKLIIPLLLVLSICSCSENGGKRYIPTDQDTLNFLVSNSDLIAIFTTLEGTDPGPKGGKDFSWKDVEVKIETVIYGTKKANDIIKVINTPYITKPDSLFHMTRLGSDTMYLCFLKNTKDHFEYKPLTGLSCPRIYGNYRLNPVWNKSETEDMAIEEVINNIKILIKKI